MATNPIERIEAIGVVPVIAIDNPADAVALADALTAGGLPIAEITFRTKAAAEVLAILRDQRPDFLAGAGTVLDLESVQACKDNGASFALSPGFDAEIVAAAKAIGLPFAPGIMTPTDLTAATRAGLRLCKFFPAGVAGGPKALEGIAAPFNHLGVRFIPTGGVTLETMGDWLKHRFVAAVGGTWIAKPEDISGGKFAEITAKAKAAVERVKAIRAGAA
ncbi:bifunctional 4-hydroxy-2-oxoglutarate aldolase/2-dehydro-3-deoxy-phosphogluconate aldolase [Labrys sp. LIt4]|uniref:bifunctional 4-hydroxy-2-oxoglutarate aldolase/2-dehydro-3-deoxy-phosphogluconate aldolase n=1 Tax=Labrys sp. LIt4 TaxID=2821355 RepID=UPI001AE05C14|nr:bifunctional 4-hydroxy-2-oxoglutarate aldolase/2-dehydro-3-deoxy-phosphogluconate aldolase [Labrys sp. LIt4]MBP0580717.1 bifunctional 4-hydroxy-2-oxoglutarate aldolase/2-dehydro-3-deoxy-phosphogluconate aldolase [Labrys sp. LIt4]